MTMTAIALARSRYSLNADEAEALAQFLASREVWREPGLSFAGRMDRLRAIEATPPGRPICHWQECEHPAAFAEHPPALWCDDVADDLELSCELHEGARHCENLDCAGVATRTYPHDCAGQPEGHGAGPCDITLSWCTDCDAGW